MQKKILPLLCCPTCRGSLRCVTTNEKEDSIVSGFLICTKCRNNYPIKEGVPVLLIGIEKGMKDVQKSFSTQWEIHQNLNEENKEEKIQTWGLEAQERKKLFLEQMDVTEKELKKKWMLDAGCGNGLLTKSLAEYDMDVVGIDISSSVFFANKNNVSPRVHFIQADVMHPPFKSVFDYVFSCGVLHHTNSTRKAFNGIAQCVKPGGRMWVWLYLKISRIKCKNWIYENKIKLYAYDIANKIISRLPTIMQRAVLLAAIPLFLIKQEIELLIGLKKFDQENQYLRKREHWKDKLVMLHDNFTPRYAYRHTPEEVMFWYQCVGFKNIVYNYKKERGGIGVRGDKPKALS